MDSGGKETLSRRSVEASKAKGCGMRAQSAGEVAGPDKATSVFESSPNKWVCFFVVLLSVLSWVASIPILLISLGGSLQPHLGMLRGVGASTVLFAILVQVDQRIAAAAVLFLSFLSAFTAPHDDLRRAMFCAFIATCMTMLNGVRTVCSPSPRTNDFLMRCFAGYFRHAELRGALHTMRQGRSFFAVHPHGILSAGWVANLVWGAHFHRMAGRCFYLIDGTLRNKGLLARLWFDACEGPHGGCRDTSRASIQALMARQESVAVIPGAYQEATHFSHGRDRVVLSQRKGFVKYCLRYGYRLHPVYTFGESQTYWTLGGLTSLRLYLNSFGIPTVIFWGEPWCPCLPWTGSRLLTYVGPPLELPQISEPSDQEVEAWHAKYVQALRKMFDEYKAEAGFPNAVLEVL